MGDQPPVDAILSTDEMTDAASWLRVTLSSIGDGVITTDPEGRVTMLNPVAQTLTGWTQEEANGVDLTEVFEIVNQDTREKVTNPALRALQDGVIVGLANHTILISKDGTERNIDDSAAPIKNDQGVVAGAILVFRDITERYRNEKLVIEGRAFAENILQTLRHALLVLDKDHRVVSANLSFYKKFDTTPEQTEGRAIWELDEGAWDIPDLRKLLGEILPENRDVVEDFEVKHDFPKIGPRVMSLNARKIIKPDNHSELTLLAIEDITERRAAEEQVTQSETRYRRLFQTAKDGILILDAETGKITDANAFMGGLVDIEAHDLIGKELHEIGFFSDIDASKKAFKELRNKGYVRYEHLPIENQNGRVVQVEVIANVYKEGEKSVAQCNIRDVTQRILMENTIKEQTEALAMESNRKDEFLAMLSHELRNPLAPIRSATYLLRMNEDSENPTQKEARKVIERQVGTLTKLVSDLLEVSRVVNGRIRLELQPVELNEIVGHAVETVQPLMSQHKHTVNVHANSDPAGLWSAADPTRIEEVLINILNNAAKYTPNGGAIDVWCEPVPGEDSVQIRILDNGIGIENDVLPFIFDLFTQADRSLDRAQGGLGIGLSLSHRLIDLHGGSIEVRSDGLGQGSEFIVRLARIPAPFAADPDLPSDLTEAATGKRVLVIDDNIDLVTIVSLVLQQKGYIVQTAFTGPDGLETTLQWMPDIVLLDIGLPGLSGYEVARRIRSSASTANTRLIALTGYGMPADPVFAIEAGFDSHLAKPFELDELESLMNAGSFQSALCGVPGRYPKDWTEAWRCDFN